MSQPRIVSLLASSTEMLYGLGLGEHVVAVSHECDYPADAATRPRASRTRIDPAAPSEDIDAHVKELSAAGQSLYELDSHLLRSLQPDIIVTQAQCEVCAINYDDVAALVKSVAGLSDTRVVSLNPNTIASIFDDIRRIGDAAGCSDRAEEFIASLRTRLEALRSKTRDLPVGRRPRVACIEWVDPLMIAGNWIPELVEIAGGRHDLSTAGSRSAYCDWKELVRYDPEVVIVMPCGLHLERAVEESAALTRRADFRGTCAARDGRVIAVDANAYFTRPGPRVVDSAEMLAFLLHANLFAQQANDAARMARSLVAGDALQ